MSKYKEARRTICFAISDRLRELDTKNYAGCTTGEMSDLLDDVREDLKGLVRDEIDKLSNTKPSNEIVKQPPTRVG